MTRRLALASFVLLTALAPAAAAEIALEVAVEGVSGSVRDNVLRLLTIEQEKRAPELNETRVRLLHARAVGEIRAALEPFGYYRADVRATLDRENDRFIAGYVIDPGPAVSVREVDLRLAGAGGDDTAFQELIAGFPLRAGAALRHRDYEDSKQALLALAAERGYFDARLTRHEIRIDLESYTAAIALHLDTGRRYRFGAVTFVQDYFDPAFLARYVPFARGEPFTNEALLRLQAALADSDYFQQIEVVQERERARDLEVPITVTLALRPPDKYTLGAGYGTDTGVRGKLGWERRPVNPGGHKLATELELSEIRSALSARYLIPVRDPRTDRVVLSSSFSEDRLVASRSQTSQLGVALERTYGLWRETLSLDYQRENFTTGADSGRTGMLMPSLGWQRVNAVQRLHPDRGNRLQFELRGSNEDLASDLTFWQARLGGKYIQPLAGNRLIVRADSGYTRASAFDDLPATLRFYTGGSQSVRGYAYQSLGPLDETGKVAGGRYLMTGSIEYEQRLTENWGAAVFYDAGRAYNDANDPSSKGAGIGVRWRLPLGVARLDVARALSLEDRPWRVHFSIGPDL